MPSTAERPATGNPQELKGRQQQQECLPQTSISDTSNISNASNKQHKDDCIIMTTHNSKQQATAGMLATTGPPTQYGHNQKQDACKHNKHQHGGRPTAIEIIGTLQRQQQKGDPQKQGCKKYRTRE
jgi:hypothetical protein